MKKDRAKELVDNVRKDFEKRKEMRSQLEANWLLNINFMIGNQHSFLAENGEIIDNGKQFYWQEREVFNHIAPIIETRLAKFSRLKANVFVRPATDDANDKNTARFATKLIKSVEEENDISYLKSIANFWSETAGTVFYKVAWNTEKGKVLAQNNENENILEGDVEISVCPPYEIYPDSLASSDIEDCCSIIHAKAYPVETIENIWGKKVKGGDVSVINMDTTFTGGGYATNGHNTKVFQDIKSNHEVVIERYSKPDKLHTNGRLTIVAGDILLYDGDLPYENGNDGKRCFPFIRQVAINQPAMFYGASIIERLIPVQRAYNAVKNRKHEYLNRLALGVMTVEEGSIDLDNLEEEGLAPGKVLIYRQGSAPPKMMSPGSVPSEFRDEEDRLLAEFISISGVSDFLSSSNLSRENLSGVALSLLIEQDDTRLSVSAESIRSAIRIIGQQILRLYRQFATTKRLKRVSGENGKIERLSFCGSDITSDDLIFDTENELSDTPASRKSMATEILKLGLLNDENGNLSEMSKCKLLEIMGFGNWESARSTEELHIKKAIRESEDVLLGKDITIDEIDNHSLHIDEHTKYIVSSEYSITDKQKEKIIKHIREHRKYQRLQKEATMLSIR